MSRKIARKLLIATPLLLVALVLLWPLPHLVMVRNLGPYPVTLEITDAAGHPHTFAKAPHAVAPQTEQRKRFSFAGEGEVTYTLRVGGTEHKGVLHGYISGGLGGDCALIVIDAHGNPEIDTFCTD
jgi:hypothetical protein